MSVLPHSTFGCDMFYLIVLLVVMSILPHCIVGCDVFYLIVSWIVISVYLMVSLIVMCFTSLYC